MTERADRDEQADQMANTSWSNAAPEPVAGGDCGSEFILAAAEVLHERMSGCQEPRGPVALQAGHRPQPRFQTPVIGLDQVVRVALHGVQGRRDQLVENRG